MKRFPLNASARREKKSHAGAYSEIQNYIRFGRKVCRQHPSSNPNWPIRRWANSPAESGAASFSNQCVTVAMPFSTRPRAAIWRRPEQRSNALRKAQSRSPKGPLRKQANETPSNCTRADRTTPNRRRVCVRFLKTSRLLRGHDWVKMTVRKHPARVPEFRRERRLCRALHAAYGKQGGNIITLSVALRTRQQALFASCAKLNHEHTNRDAASTAFEALSLRCSYSLTPLHQHDAEGVSAPASASRLVCGALRVA